MEGLCSSRGVMRENLVYSRSEKLPALLGRNLTYISVIYFRCVPFQVQAQLNYGRIYSRL